jgi:hypothetical protein
MFALDRPRAPAAPLGAALYESHYLTAVAPGGGRALWLRHTALKRPGDRPRPTAWFTFFDVSAPAPRALRVTAPEPLGDPGEAWWRSSLGEMGPSGARGELSDPARAAGLARAGWDLTWRPRAGEVAYLPVRALYDRAVPRSNGAALVPAATARGRLALDDEEVPVEDWEAMVGHNWGCEHAHAWCWLHAGGLGDDGRGWLDLVLVRVRIGPIVTPWIASGAVELEDRRWSPAPLRRATCVHAGERTEVAVSLSPRAVLRLSVRAPQRATMTWDYASPRGQGRIVDNCSVADAELRLTDAAGSRTLTATGTVAVEHGAPA